MTIKEQTIRDALRHVRVPGEQEDIVSAGMVSGMVVRDGHVGVMLTMDPAKRAEGEQLQQQVIACLSALDGVEQVTPVLTAHQEMTESAQKDVQAAPASAPKKRAVWNQTPLAHVTRIIAVASGKGGVGKSTVTALLALEAAQAGKRVGILDADIYGPSIPHMMGLADAGKPELAGSMMVPHISEAGIACMSIGFLLEEGQAAIMRGAMVSKTLHQLLRQTQWGTEEAPLDVLYVDMPPGTGDVHLSMAQQVPLQHGASGAVIVSTPQELALLDARKAIAMFEKIQVPILGVIENMGYLEHPTSGEAIPLFGEGGGAALAKQTGAPLIASLPMRPALRESADAGALSRYVANMQHLLCNDLL